jgi:hypothetical protein
MSTIREILDLLSPHHLPLLTMERWGPDADGAYIVPANIMKHSTVLLSGGVGDNVHFEADVAKHVPGIRMELYDHTIAAPPEHMPPGAIWHKIALSRMNRPGAVTLETAYENAKITKEDVVAIKLDIEDSEWSVIRATSDDFWANVSVLVIELHNLGVRSRRPRYRSVLEKLNTHLLPIHVHGNNYATMSEVRNYDTEIPEVIEVTYLNRKWFTPVLWEHDAPTLLDQSNCPGRADYTFNYWSDRKSIFGKRVVRKLGKFLTTGQWRE